MIDADVRAVFFDAVGTLLFPVEPISQTYRTVAAEHGINLDETTVRQRLRAGYLRQEEFDQQQAWQTNEERERDRWRKVVFDVLQVPDGEACFQALWHWYSTPQAWRLHPETTSVIGELARRGVVLGMASNFDARLQPLVDTFAELAPLRERCLISSHIGWRKPSPAFFAEVERVAGCPANQIMFVGDDRQNDYDGAQASGMNAVLLSPEGWPADVCGIATLCSLVK